MNAKYVSSTVAPILVISAMLAGAAALAAEQQMPSATSAPSKEMREKMAAIHERMAVCLRSDKTVTECRTEMQKDCQSMMGAQGCRMMGPGMGMRGGMMNPPPANQDNKK